MNDSCKVGLMGIGLDTYWPQFPELKPKLAQNQSRIRKELEGSGVTVVDVGILDKQEQALPIAANFRKEDIDVLFVNISTYALSQIVLPVLQQLKTHVVLLNISPYGEIDFDQFNGLPTREQRTGAWLELCQSCVAPELASVLRRANIPFQLISGHLDDPEAWEEAKSIIQAVRITKFLRQTKLGLIGNYYSGMMDVYSDITQLSSFLGHQNHLLEFGMIKKYRKECTDSEVKNKLDEFHETFDVSTECSGYELERAARTSLALDFLVKEHGLGCIAYYFEGQGDDEYLDLVTSLIPGLTLLTGRNVPCAGEFEVKNALAMKIMDLLGSGGSFSEFYAIDYQKNIILLGHDGPAHFAIADGKVGLVPLGVYHGKPGKGLSIQMQVKPGPITMLSVCQGFDGKVFFLYAEGEAIEGPTFQIGNTNSQYRFPLSAKNFITQWSLAGPSHHCAIGTGRQGHVIEQMAKLLGLSCIKIC
ncbi:putative L-arabinose isomerase [Lunatimonas lonarensis]|uniref:Putative L-arabinose isomerase n=1 Tax=Lunatimonas lonarensis TaxID=1232681 RepID=R7ZLG3_9BACT|nr:L-fucose/L-arabinose isomerase family protein [Lunatimonas lonarensis]EON74912.1 putative L-arabinose isomerase [Lunatimonas lonarensis]